MNEFLYAGLEIGASFLGAGAVINNALIACVEYRNRRVSNGETGIVYHLPDSYAWGSNLREPFSSLAYFAQPVLEPLADIIFNLPGENIGRGIYKWKHGKQNVNEQPPTSISSEEK